jgi:hypothetical protein
MAFINSITDSPCERFAQLFPWIMSPAEINNESLSFRNEFSLVERYAMPPRFSSEPKGLYGSAKPWKSFRYKIRITVCSACAYGTDRNNRRNRQNTVIRAMKILFKILFTDEFIRKIHFKPHLCDSGLPRIIFFRKIPDEPE